MSTTIGDFFFFDNSALGGADIFPAITLSLVIVSVVSIKIMMKTLQRNAAARYPYPHIGGDCPFNADGAGWSDNFY